MNEFIVSFIGYFSLTNALLIQLLLMFAKVSEPNASEKLQNAWKTSALLLIAAAICFK